MLKKKEEQSQDHRDAADQEMGFGMAM